MQVIELKTYDTFKEMYEDIPFKKFDCEGWTMKKMMDGTYDIYTSDQERELDFHVFEQITGIRVSKVLSLILVYIIYIIRSN